MNFGLRSFLALMFIGISLQVHIIMSGGSSPQGDELVVEAYVMVDEPKSPIYAPMEGEPKNVGIYEFYLALPMVPGTGEFKNVGSIELEKINETTYWGQKNVERIQGPLCVGYPTSNFVDGMACTPIDQERAVATVVVHYWRTLIGILGPTERRVVVLANSIDWSLCGEVISNYYSQLGIPCERVDASDFDLKKGASFMLILGGQLAYDGVGNISQQVLPQSIQLELVENRQAHRGYSGFNLWAGSQQVIVLAGHDRYLTEKAVEEAFRSQ